MSSYSTDVTAEQAVLVANFVKCSVCGAERGATCSPDGEVHRRRTLTARNRGVDGLPLRGRSKKAALKRRNLETYGVPWLNGTDYPRHLASPVWAATRERYYAKYGTECQVPGCPREAGNLHHHTYIRLGAERLTDLVGLCRPHHMEVHAFHKKWRADLIEAAKATGKRTLTLATEQVTGLKLIP